MMISIGTKKLEIFEDVLEHVQSSANCRITCSALAPLSIGHFQLT